MKYLNGVTLQSQQETHRSERGSGNLFNLVNSCCSQFFSDILAPSDCGWILIMIVILVIPSAAEGDSGDDNVDNGML